MTHPTKCECNSELLRGRQGIAEYIKTELKVVDRLIDTGVIPVFRVSRRLMFTTKFLVRQGFENEALSKAPPDVLSIFQEKRARDKKL